VHTFSDLKLAFIVVFIWAVTGLIDHWLLILYTLAVLCIGYLLRRAMEVHVDDSGRYAFSSEKLALVYNLGRREEAERWEAKERERLQTLRADLA